MKFFKNYPRISSLLIGFALGLVMVSLNDRHASATLSEYKSLVAIANERYERVIAKSHTEIESLSRMNETLKQHIKTRKTVSPDGTIVEETDTDTNTTTITETQIRTKIESEYEKKITEIEKKHTETVTKLTNRKLRLGLGYTSELEYYGHGNYNINGPFSIGGGITSGGTLMLDFGVSL